MITIPMTPEPSNRTRILLPCGIGDVYWSLVKLRAFCRKQQIVDKPKVAIITTKPELRYEGSEYRSLEFLKMVPFVEIDDPPNREAHPLSPEPPWLHKIYMDMWHGTKTVYPGFMGYDYFFVYNGAITNGIPLEKIDDLECEWDLPLIVSDAQKNFQEQCQQKYGKYVVYLWSFCEGGYSSYHVKEFHPKQIIESINQFTAKTKLTPVFVGSWWDFNFGNNYLREAIKAVKGSVNLVGKTNIDQLFGVLKGSEMVVGCHCGPTIMAAVFNKKTIILWARSYPSFAEGSPLVVVPPAVRNTTYRPLYTHRLTVEGFTKQMLDLVGSVDVEGQELTDTCLCGGHCFEDYKQESYHVDATGTSVPVQQKFGKCTACGLVKQFNIPFKDNASYLDYYTKYPPTSTEYKAKDWTHDLELATKRCDAYQINAAKQQRVLDVGSGSGAFVAECRNRNQDAYGSEIAQYAYAQPSDRIYYGKTFEQVNFPTDHFDLTTCHDVLEHVLDPVSMLAEMHRVTKQEGRCIIDVPRFFHDAGKHHWKDNEHVWFFNEEQLATLLRRAGFLITDVKNPIESKLVFYCSKPKQRRPLVLIPPGIGDSYWSIVKMQSFLASEKLGLVDVAPISGRSGKVDGNNRAVPFLDMFPFIHAVNGSQVENKSSGTIWHEAYMLQGRTVFRDVLGADYLLSYNGHLRRGTSLDKVDPQYACDWHPTMFVSLEQEQYKAQAKQSYGPYFVCYFPFYSTYSHWANEFPLDRVVESINLMQEQTGLTPVFAGAAWDANDVQTRRVFSRVPEAVNVMGRTTIAQLFGLLRGAEAVVGYPSGLTIMAAVLGVKTLIVWNKYYNKDFAWYCAPPDVRARTYFTDWTYQLTPERLAGEVTDLVENGAVDVRKYPRLVPDTVFTNPSTISQSIKRVRPARVPTVRKQIKQVGTKQIVRQPVVSDPAVLCVLKSGGEYNVDYVQKLKAMVARHTTIVHQFYCLTDIDIDHTICKTLPLVKDYVGWWSKIELFRQDLVLANRIVYFDLDTVILNNIDELFTVDVDFAALGDWHQVPDRGKIESFGSGLMVWQNNGRSYSFLYNEFDPARDIQKRNGNNWNVGDQMYIAKSLMAHEVKPEVIQDKVTGIYSYKRNNCARQLPQDARIVCFHGRPRPHQALHVRWVRNYWR